MLIAIQNFCVSVTSKAFVLTGHTLFSIL